MGKINAMNIENLLPQACLYTISQKATAISGISDVYFLQYLKCSFLSSTSSSPQEPHHIKQNKNKQDFKIDNI